MKTNIKRIASNICIIVLLVCASCSKKDNDNFQEVESVAMVSDANDSGETDNVTESVVEDETDIQQRKLIKSGEISFETEDLATTKMHIEQAVEKFNGYISSDQIYTSSGTRSNSLTIRIPANNFDSFLSSAIDSIQELEHKDIHVDDVTEEFLDVQARVKTKKELEQRYLELLQKTHKVSEILEIERELGTLRAEIESIEGRLNYLKNQVSLSTLTITFYEDIPIENEYGQELIDGFKNGWQNFIWFFIMLTHVWPFLLVIAILITLFIMYMKKKRRQKQQQS